MKSIINVILLQDLDKSSPPHAFLVIYSVVDKASFLRVESDLTRLSEAELLRTRPAILVGNKVDLARSKAVSTQGYYYMHAKWIKMYRSLSTVTLQRLKIWLISEKFTYFFRPLFVNLIIKIGSTQHYIISSGFNKKL